MMRAALGVLAVALVAACSGADVRTESAVEPPASTDAATTTDAPPEPSTTAVPDATEAPATTAAPPTTAPGDPGDGPSTSSGDSLLPELGSADLDVQSYDVRLSYDMETKRLAGTVDITTTVTRQLDEFALDAADVTVESVTVDGEPATFEHRSPELIVRAGDRRSSPTRRSSCRSPTATTGMPAHSRSSSAAVSTRRRSGRYTFNEPDGGRTWLPSNDHPSDKATWRFELTVPAGTTAVANGVLVEERQDNGDTTWVWELDEPMATYLVQVLIGPYSVLDGGVVGDVEVTNVALSDDVTRMQPYFNETAEQIEFFEPLFGPYPLDGYGLAFVDSVPRLALEQQGRPLFSRDDFPGGTPDPTAQLFLSHELAHQWFGNAVTPADWSDLWLNESFASYAQWLWFEHIGLTTVELEANRNLAQRQTPTEPTGTPSAGNLFGYERYDGGAVVLHALRGELGDEAFFTVLQRWVAENVGTSRVSADFIALAEDVAGRSLTEFFDAWLYSPSVPPAYPG